MNKDNKMLTNNQFHKIFSYKKIYNLLSIKIQSYSIINYYMNFFLTNQLYYLNKNSKADIIKRSEQNKIILINKFIYILKQSFVLPTSYETLDILFLSRNRVSTIKTKHGDEFFSDYLFGNIIHDLKRKKSNLKTEIVSMQFDPTPAIDDIKLYSLIEYSSPFIFLRSIVLSILLNFKWRMDKKEIESFLKENQFNYLIPSLNQFFRIVPLFYIYLYDYSLQKVLTKHQPKLIMVNDDVMLIKPNIDTERSKFAFLQSAIMDNDKEYFKKLFINYFSLNESLPDFFLVSGIKSKNLIRASKCSKEVLVVGQPRYDILSVINNIYSKEEFFKKYNIDPNKKIILWTTQCHGMDLNENIKNFNTVFNAFTNTNNVTLLIKQHPAEGDEYDQLIKKFINLYKLNILLLPKTSDTYEQIFFSDLVITKDSTTGLEAIALDKPLLILNLSGNQDIMDYVNKGVAVGVYSENNLVSSIEKLLKDDSDLAKNRSSFLLENIYQNDGKSTERIITFIEDLIN